MRRTALAVLLSFCLILTAPAMAAAHPKEGDHGKGHHGEEHRMEHHRADVDWSQYPAEFQTYKNTLDQLKEEQKGLFEQFKKQREQIREAHQKMSEDKRQAFRNNVQDLLGELRTTRDAIHSLSSEKRAAWKQFHQHASEKNWDAAKVDMQTIIAKKQEIVAKQKQILETQKKIVEKIQK